jgi:DNA-directed RNA polymerase subunit N (RpoN/RPB10)
MIIPVRCYGCNNLLASKYYYYKEKVAEHKKRANMPLTDTIINVNSTDVEKTIEGKLLDSLGLVRLCCRSHMMGHIEFE